MAKTKASTDMAAAIKELEARGYKVNRPVKTVRHTFEIREELLKDVFKVAAENDLYLKDCMDAALSGWVEKMKKRAA
ncbi:MAG: hypothetical protein NDI61_01895 [Bdellovibrionaceae bacterium]|nr:hypothetical protein [Pseudobdellovibrionaceae bacterium]